jgi:hypothetical protein
LVVDFLDVTFGGVEDRPEFAGIVRSMTRALRTRVAG